MAQVTIYLDDETLTVVKTATKTGGVSQSQWIAEAVRERAKREWPAAVLALAGAWSDFPSADEIRAKHGVDVKRERL